MATKPSDEPPLTNAEIKYAIEQYVEAKWNILAAELQQYKADIDAAIAQSTEECVKSSDAIAIQSCNGQVLCATDGGPSEPNQVFKFESRNPDAIGPHETFVVLKP